MGKVNDDDMIYNADHAQTQRKTRTAYKISKRIKSLNDLEHGTAWFL